MGSNFNLFFDLIEMGAGIYILITGIRMKQTGKITQTGLLGKSVRLDKARDVAGFIKEIFPIYIICGIGLFALGAASAYVDTAMPNIGIAVNLTITGSLLVFCFVFAFFTKKAQDKYLM
ncbi:MAG: hypothetical protein K5989_06255 [Lachnospiraceae bacterium]|nr:hypothetical protein [Lachnospiraceae bacterium]